MWNVYLGDADGAIMQQMRYEPMWRGNGQWNGHSRFGEGEGVVERRGGGGSHSIAEDFVPK